MSMHGVFAGMSGASGAATAGMLAAVHSDTLLLIPACISSLATVIGACIAVAAFVRHRDGVQALEDHEKHDDERFDQLERLITESMS